MGTIKGWRIGTQSEDFDLWEGEKYLLRIWKTAKVDKKKKLTGTFFYELAAMDKKTGDWVIQKRFQKKVQARGFAKSWMRRHLKGNKNGDRPMSYYMNIVRCDLIRTDMSKDIDEIDELYLHWDWEESNDGVEPPEDYFKWDDEFINDLVKLAKIDVVGEVITRGEEGEATKYILKDDEVEEYYGETVFPDEPNEVHTEEENYQSGYMD